MKQQINPVAAVIGIVVLVGVVIVIAVRTFSSPVAQSGPAPLPAENATINGQKVPAGAPSAAFQKAREESGGK